MSFLTMPDRVERARPAVLPRIFVGLTIALLSCQAWALPPQFDSQPADQIINENSTTGQLLFEVSDPDSNSIHLSATSNNQALIPNANLSIGSGGGPRDTRRVEAVPALNQSGGPVTITLRIFDNQGEEAFATFLVTVLNTINTAPAVNAPASIGVTEDQASPLAGMVFADPDAGAAAVRADFSVPAGALTAVDGGNVTVTGSGTGSLSLNGNVSDINAFVAGNNLSYQTASNDSSAQTLSVSMNDLGNTGSGGAQTSPIVPVTLNVAAVNDTPSATAPATINVTEDQASPLAPISFADVDAGLGAVRADFGVSAGTLSGVDGGGVTVIGSGSNTLSLNGSLAAINAFLSGNNLNYLTATNSTADATLSLSLSDLGNSGSGPPQTSPTQQSTLTVAAVNDAPSAAAPAMINVTEDVDSPLAPISFTDVDAGVAAVRGDFSVAAGTLSANSGAGVVVAGSGTASLSLSGTLVDINAFIAANQVNYLSVLNSSAGTTLSVSVEDLGNSGSGGSQTSPVVQVALNGIPVNDTPTADTDLFVATEEVQLVIAAPGVLDGDTDVELDALSAQLVTPTSGGSINLATDGGFTYTPGPNYFGSDTFTYSACDPAPACSNPVTVTVNVGPTPDADLSVSIFDGRSFVSGGTIVQYQVTVANSGPDAVPGARVQDVQPANLSGVTWSCAVLTGAPTCAAPGTGAIDALLDLPASSSVRFTISGTLAALPENLVIYAASVATPATLQDGNTSNNNAIDTNEIGIFANGFELPAP